MKKMKPTQKHSKYQQMILLLLVLIHLICNWVFVYKCLKRSWFTKTPLTPCHQCLFTDSNMCPCWTIHTETSGLRFRLMDNGNYQWQCIMGNAIIRHSTKKQQHGVKSVPTHSRPQLIKLTQTVAAVTLHEKRTP